MRRFGPGDLVTSQNTDHAVVLRCLTARPILSEIQASGVCRATTSAFNAQTKKKDTPLSASELNAHVTDVVIECIMSTLALPRQMVDIHVALSEFDLDSIMNLGVRRKP